MLLSVQEGPQLFPNYEKVVQCSAESGDISASDPKSGSANTKLCVTNDTGHCGLIISGDSSGYTAFNWYWNACNFLKLFLLVIQTNDCDCLHLKSSCHLKCLQENVLIIFNYFNLTVPQSRPFKLRQLNWLCEIFLCKYFLLLLCE